jgi:HEAT repeat protein
MILARRFSLLWYLALSLAGLAVVSAATAQSVAPGTAAQASYAGEPMSVWVDMLAEHLGKDTKQDKDLCQKAARAIGQIGPPAREAVPLLVEAIGATSVDVRRPAIDALGRIGPDARDAVPAIIKEVDLPKDHVNYAPLAYFRRLAARALGRIGPDAAEAVPVLQKALENEDDVYRVEAAVALWKISQYPETVATLESVIRQGGTEGAYEAVMAILELGAEGETATATLVAALGHTDPDVRRAAAKVLAQFGPAMLEPVATLLQEDPPEAPESAAYVLGEILDPLRTDQFYNRQLDARALAAATISVVRLAAPALVKLLYHPREEVRRTAVRSLSRMGLLAVPFLLPALKSSNAAAQQAAIDALARLEPYLPESWPSSEGMELIKGKQIEPLMGLMRETDAESRRAAFRLFDRLHYGPEAGAAAPLLRNALRDRDISIRRSAFEALERLGTRPVPRSQQAEPTTGS